MNVSMDKSFHKNVKSNMVEISCVNHGCLIKEKAVDMMDVILM